MRALTVAVLFFVGCAHGVPTVASKNPDDCVDVDPPEPATTVAPHGNEVGVCFADNDCFVVDHVHGHIVGRTGIVHTELGDPPELRLDRPPERFETVRTETETSVCDRDKVCRTLTLPGVADQRTVLPAISASGHELYFVARDNNQAFLDTIAIDARGRRTGRVPLPIGAGSLDDHGFTVERVGTAILVRDSISLGLNNERSQQILVDPLTGATRSLLSGSAVALDETTAVVMQSGRADIIKTQGLATITSRTTGDGMAAGANGKVAVLAHSNPPTLIVIENRRFTRTWRLPTCKR
jgi:hypothetical protein